MKSKVLIVLLAAFFVYTLFNRIQAWKNTSMQWDKLGYYSYLPAVFIYDDLSTLSFYTRVSQQYKFTGDLTSYALYEQPGGKRLNKYAIGTAFFELPFFLVAHAYTTTTKEYEPDGFSHPYQLAVAFSNIFWVIMGLFVLRKFLANFFPDNVVSVTLLCLAIGTNLYNYTAFDHGMSHPYSFFLFSAVLYLTDKWYKDPRGKHICLLGLILGWVVITRPVNLVIAVIPLLWRVGSFHDLRQRFLLLCNKWRQIVMAMICFFIVCLIQMGYWKCITGHWLYYSYEGEGFNFLSPNIWNGLFSYRKGWFVYTPLAFLGMIGFYSLGKRQPKLVAPLAVFFVLFIYVVFSWNQWWYGGSFGSRPMIEALAVLSLPFASLCYDIYRRRFVAGKIAFSAILVFVVALNMFQSYQFLYGIIPVDNTSKEYYWRAFLKLSLTDEEKKS
jgi:hypothetical protein